MTAMSFDYSSGNKYRYNGKELQDDMGLDWFDYGARFYDPALGRWFSEDPLAEGYFSNSPYHFSGNNPVRFLDLNGMNYDDFYFAQDGELIAYVENDDPDRVFVAKDDEQVEANLKNATDQGMYDEVEMTNAEVEEKMNDNGYQKVTKEETVEQVEIHSNTVEPKGLNETITTLVDKTLEVKFKYVEKGTPKTNTKIEHIRTLDRKFGGSYWFERNTVRKTYEYGKKQDHTKRNSKVGSFILKLLPAIKL